MRGDSGHRGGPGGPRGTLAAHSLPGAHGQTGLLPRAQRGHDPAALLESCPLKKGHEERKEHRAGWGVVPPQRCVPGTLLGPSCGAGDTAKAASELSLGDRAWAGDGPQRWVGPTAAMPPFGRGTLRTTRPPSLAKTGSLSIYVKALWGRRRHLNLRSRAARGATASSRVNAKPQQTG